MTAHGVGSISDPLAGKRCMPRIRIFFLFKFLGVADWLDIRVDLWTCFFIFGVYAHDLSAASVHFSVDWSESLSACPGVDNIPVHTVDSRFL